jgi:hypothetical protein
MGLVKNQKIGFMNSSVAIPAGTAAERPSNPIFGQIRFNTTIGKVEYFDGTVFATIAKQGDANIEVDSFTGNGSDTVFGSMAYSIADATQVLVFVGNIYQIPTTNYTVAGTYDITFTSAPPTGMPINIIHNLSSNEVA